MGAQYFKKLSVKLPPPNVMFFYIIVKINLPSTAMPLDVRKKSAYFLLLAFEKSSPLNTGTSFACYTLAFCCSCPSVRHNNMLMCDRLFLGHAETIMPTTV